MNLLRALWQRFDDGINPIVIKELRQAVKSRMVVTILLLFLALQLLVLGFFLLSREARSSGDNVDWYLGNDVFKWQQGILLFSLGLLVPAYAAIRLLAERYDQNVDLLFISTLRPGSIIWGKFAAALTLAVLIFSTCAPFMTFTYLLRGIDLPTIFLILGIDLVVMMFVTMAALLIGSMWGGLVLKVLYMLIFFGNLLWVTIMLVTGTVALAEIGVGVLALEELWPAYLVGLASVLGLTGAMYFCAVALISAPSSNRTRALRIYSLAWWVLMGAAVWWVTVWHEPVVGARLLVIWTVVSTSLLGVLFLISICERDGWGPRITRSVPRGGARRLLAWLTTTGAGGGIQLCAIMAVGGFLLVGLLLDAQPGMFLADGAWVVLRGATVAALYGYCYGLSAALLRAYIMREQIKSSVTWLLVILLVGIGSSVPAVISFVMSMDKPHEAQQVKWWMVPNPFVAVYEMVPGPWRAVNDDFVTVSQWFLGIWAMVVTGLALPWYAGMLRRFSPLTPAPLPQGARGGPEDPLTPPRPPLPQGERGGPANGEAAHASQAPPHTRVPANHSPAPPSPLVGEG